MKIPKAPKFSLALIGPGIVLVAMGLGSGEFILWPYLVAEFGFGIIWGAVVGITAQYFVSNESGRYTLATGGSIYTAFSKLNKYLPHWFILSTFASFAWPGIIASSGTIFANLLNISDPRIPTIFMLLLIGVILTYSGKVYSSLEIFQKVVIAVSIPILIVIALMLADGETLDSFSQGLVGIGEGYRFIPGSISVIAFLGAVAYSGAGGNLVLSHSFYIQDEGLGMAKNFDSQISRKNLDKEVIKGDKIEESDENTKNFFSWFKVVALEQLISFWFIGLLTIFLLTFIAYSLAYPFEGLEGLDFVFVQADALTGRFGEVIGTFFLLVGGIFLFKTQLGVYETTSRIMTENIQLASEKFKDRYSRSKIYFFFLWAQIVSAIFITLLGISEPVQILLIQTFFSALSMLVLSILVQIVNNSKLLPDSIKPGVFRNLTLCASVIFFGVFVVLTIYDVVIGL